MEFLNFLWLDAERGIGTTQLQTKMSKRRSFFNFFKGILIHQVVVFQSLFQTFLVLGGIMWWCET